MRHTSSRYISNATLSGYDGRPAFCEGSSFTHCCNFVLLPAAANRRCNAASSSGAGLRATSATPAQRCHHVCRRIDNALNLRGERLEGMRHFGVIFVLIINGPRAAKKVTKAAFANVGGDPCLAHPRSCRSAAVVQGPACHTAGGVKNVLWQGE